MIKMSNVVLIGSDCGAYGHPTECQEPVSGSVNRENNSKVTLDGSDVYFHSRANMTFSSHSHDYSLTEGCHQNSSHSIDPDDTHSVTLDGSSIVLEDDEGTDPVSGGRIEITNTNGNKSFKLLET